MYVRNANGDGRNGQTTQAGATVAQALMMAAPCGIYSSAATQHALQFPPLCGVSSAVGPQPVDWISPWQTRSLPHSAVRWFNAQWPAVKCPYRPQIHIQSSQSLLMLDNTLLVHEIVG